MPKMKSLGGLFIDLLKDMYYGEKQIADRVRRAAVCLRAPSEGDGMTSAAPRWSPVRHKARRQDVLE